MGDEDTLLVPNDVYLKSGIHIGTKFRTKYMEQFIYKTRSDGLSVLNIKKIDERLGLLANMLSQYEAKDILIVSRRENAWKALRLFQKYTGIPVIAGRYMPGILTNPDLKTFIQPKFIVVTDPWPDKNAVDDANRVGIPVVALCDTNNQSNKLDLVMPCNNKGKKSLGLLFFVLAREYLLRTEAINKPEEFSGKLEDFQEE